MRLLKQFFLPMALLMSIAGDAFAHTSPTAQSILQHLAHVFGSAHHLYGGLLLCLVAIVAYVVIQSNRTKNAQVKKRSNSSSNSNR
jgi:hypothetical protein